MSKDALLSSASGITVSLMAVNTALVSNAVEVFVFGMLGGVGGILGKMLVSFVVKKIKNYKSKSKV